MEGNTKPKKPRKGSKARAYRQIQEIAVLRDRVCQHPTCGRPVQVGHHVWGRANMGTAFLPEAVVGLCAECHQKWAHGLPVSFKRWFENRIGDAEYQALERLAHGVVKYQDMDEICGYLDKVLQAYGKGW